jgi:hypothetical protein
LRGWHQCGTTASEYADAVALLDDLIDQYGLGGIVSLDPYSMGDGPDDWRYVVTIDGETRPDLEVKTLPRQAARGWC